MQRDPDPAHSSPTTPPALPPPRSSDLEHLVVCYSTQCRSHTVWDQMPIATTLPGSPTLSNQVSHATPTARRATHMSSLFDTPSAASWPSPPCSHMGLPAALATGAAGTCVAGRSPCSAPSALGRLWHRALDSEQPPCRLGEASRDLRAAARSCASRAPRRVVATAEDGLSAPRATLSPLGVAAAAPT